MPPTMNPEESEDERLALSQRKPLLAGRDPCAMCQPYIVSPGHTGTSDCWAGCLCLPSRRHHSKPKQIVLSFTLKSLSHRFLLVAADHGLELLEDCSLGHSLGRVVSLLQGEETLRREKLSKVIFQRLAHMSILLAFQYCAYLTLVLWSAGTWLVFHDPSLTANLGFTITGARKNVYRMLKQL